MDKFQKRKIVTSIILVAITALVIFLIIINPPESKRKKPSKAPQLTVEAVKLNPQNYQVMVQSFGTVEPSTQSVLFTQVSGQINYVNPQFRAGGFFKKGDILIELDNRDFQAEVKVAQAALISRQQTVEEENARAQQAKIDWQRLGNGKEATALVLRKPQLEAAKAQMLSAQAEFEKAQLALERTKVIAPYSGRILQKHVDIGQVVSSNTELADIYATDYVEIRLPINNKDLAFMSLPEEIESNQLANQSNKAYAPVIISSTLIGNQLWQGQIVRTESAIDDESQQLYVVANILNPYEASSSQGGQIKIGQYITAEITGKILEQVIVIPSSAIYQGSYVYTVEEGILKRKNITISWQNGEQSIISSGLNFDEQLVLTPLGQVYSGTPVAIDGQPLVSNNQLSKSDTRRKKLEKIAKEKNISIEDVIQEQQQKRAQKGNN